MTAPDFRPLSWWWTQQAPVAPEEPALIDPDGRTHTRQEVADTVRALAGMLSARGISRQDRLALVMNPGPGMAATLLGVMATAVAAPLPPSSPATVLADSFERLGVTAVLVDDDPSPAVIDAAARVGVPLIELDPFQTDPSQLEVPSQLEAAGSPVPAPAPNDTALILQTSGTTARPKVVPLTHANLQASTTWLARSLDLGPADRSLLVMPLFHIAGIAASLLAPLAAGGSVICSRRTAPQDLLRAVVDLEATWVSASPAFLHALESEVNGAALRHHLRFLRTAGAPPYRKLVDRLTDVFGVPVVESYGMTEVAGVDLYAIRKGAPSGSPEVTVVDSHGRRLAPTATGEIAVRGDNVTAGYDGADASGWIENASGERWFLTGDQGYIDADGRLVLGGRIKELINRGGEKVIPSRVDEALHAHPDVKYAMAFPVPHPTLGEDLAAAVVPHGDVVVSEHDLRLHAAEHLPVHEVPSRILVMAELPRTQSGKLNRAALAELLAAHLVLPEAHPEGDVETLVADVFAEVLGSQRPGSQRPGSQQPGRDANFFMLGGDSLSGQRVISRLAGALGRDLSPVVLFENPTPRTLADRIGASRRSVAGGPIPPAAPVVHRTHSAGEAFAVSYGQERMWFLHQLEPELTAYHLPALWRLRGDLDVDALRRALKALVERHPTLHTAFELCEGEVLQIVGPPPERFALDLEVLADRDEDSVVERWMDLENSTPFDLAGGALLRARLLKTSPDEHLLLLNHHHIASDGWSRSVLCRDLTDLYNAQVHGGPSRLQPLRARYQDYAKWHRSQLSASAVSESLAYWKTQLDGVPAMELPCDHPRPPSPSYRGGRAGFDVDADDLSAFEGLCRAEGATLQMGFLALTALLLSRYSRQNDFAIGVPHWGRSHPDLEDLVGLFVNTLPIRVRRDGGHSFREFLAQVRRTSIGAYEHHALPFEHIVDAVAPQRDMSRNPLVQVLLQLVELPAPSLDGLSGVEAQSQDIPDDTVRVDLEFVLRRTAQGALGGTIVFARDLFSPDRIERMATHLRTLLRSVIGSPDARTDDLDMVGGAERSLIEGWQRGRRAEPSDIGVHQMVERQARGTPDAVAIIAGDLRVSYAELDARAGRLARTLIRSGVGPEKVVAVCLARSVDWVVAQLAIFKAGGAYMPLDPALPQARLDGMLEMSDAGILLVDNDSASRFTSVTKPVIDVTAPASDLPAVERDESGYSPGRLAYAPERLAYVLFTSGSTGTPKGVEVEHRVLANLVRWHAAHPRLGRPARTLQFASCGFDVSLQEVFSTLTVGGCLVLIDRETQRDSRLLLTALTTHDVERVFLPYVALEQLAVTAAQSGVPGCLRDVISAGERLALTPPIRKFFAAIPDCRLHNHYGPTETHVVTADQLQPEVDAWRDEAGIGRPVENAEVRVVEPSGQPCPVGIPGELWIGGASLARGYLHNPGLTARKFDCTTGGFADADRFYRSGDLACWNPDGTLSFHGRLDDQIKVRGFRVEPDEIATALLECPGVAQAAVVPVRHPTAGPRLVAYCVPEPGRRMPDAERLRALLQRRLPDYMIPEAVVELARLPLTQNGKLDRGALPAPSFSCADARVAASSAVERELSARWADVLGHEDFGVHDNFFLVGGHSLSAVRLAAAMELRFGDKVPVSEIFRRPTIAEQAAWVAERSDDRQQVLSETDRPAGNVVTLQPHGDLPALYALHGWRGTVAPCHLSRAMGSRRPLLGLQASGIEHDAGLPAPSVEAIASRYADQIMARSPGETIHLVGFSAGGWYAYAVADALLQRGARIGLFAVLDTGGTARIHRRIGLVTLPLRLVPRLRVHVANLIAPPGGQRRVDYLRSSLRALNRHLDSFLLHHRNVDDGLRQAALLGSDGAGSGGAGSHGVEADSVDPDGDFYVVLHRGYRPPRLPIVVDVFAPAERVRFLGLLWRFYARGGVRTHPIFRDHSDFVLPEKAEPLAAALTSALAEAERATPRRGRRTPTG